MSEVDSNWASVAEYGNLRDAQRALMQLLGLGVPAEIRDLNGLVPTYDEVSAFYLWVPAKLLDQAKALLNPVVISEEELTREALESPPPDDA